MLRRAALLITDVSEEHTACIIRVTRIGELGTLGMVSSGLLRRENLKSYIGTLALTNNRRTLRRKT
jgi:hypothetical protein